MKRLGPEILQRLTNLTESEVLLVVMLEEGAYCVASSEPGDVREDWHQHAEEWLDKMGLRPAEPETRPRKVRT